MATIKELWNRMFNRSDELSLKKLLSCDKKGVTYLEQLCRSGQLDFNDEIFEQIKNSKEALYICAYFNRLSWLSSFSNEDVFFEKVDGNRLLIEFILEKDTTLDSNFLANFKKHPEVIDYVALYHPERLNQLSNDLIAKMFVSENGVFPVDKNINVIRQFILIPSVVPFDILLNYCKKKSNFDFFIGCSEELLLKDIGSGKILFEELLDRKIDTKYTFRDLKDPKLLNILVKKSRMNLLQFACNESLCLKYDEKNTYLDLLIAERSKNNNINIPFFNSFDNLSVESVAQIILIYARNGLIDKLPKIRVSTLLESRWQENLFRIDA